MRTYSLSGRSRRPILPEDPDGLAARLKDLLVGQPEAIDTIIPYIQMHQAGLAPEGRPVGVVLLLGPTGTGKTRTVEALAEVLHGNSKNLLKVDCGEFQMEHEVAKLIGAPPGYLGHRETQPMLTQAKLNSVATEQSDISLVLFDEIEKAAPSMTRLLLGILDKATLRLGDNSTVNFERSPIFLTRTLGANNIQRL
jgi:ATP-dependent Clp protease ATP-binding subunit ClpA